MREKAPGALWMSSSWKGRSNSTKRLIHFLSSGFAVTVNRTIFSGTRVAVGAGVGVFVGVGVGVGVGVMVGVSVGVGIGVMVGVSVGAGVGVAVGVLVGVGMGVGGMVGVFVGVGVTVGPNNCPGPQAERRELAIRKKRITICRLAFIVQLLCYVSTIPNV
jgi:hypothetical protein